MSRACCGACRRERPRTFHEALQALRFMNAIVWLSGHHHVGSGGWTSTCGRTSPTTWPRVAWTTRGAEELLAEFFIALNRDSDLYPGIQQGDNGQTVTLGGVTRDGRPASIRSPGWRCASRSTSP